VAHDVVNPRILKLETAKEILDELFDFRTHEVDEMIRQRRKRTLRDSTNHRDYICPR
jgi:hypothetical protein